jgi:flagellar assembly protein FliH
MKPPETFTRHQAVGAYRLWSPPAFDAPPTPKPAPAPTPKAENPPASAAAKTKTNTNTNTNANANTPPPTLSSLPPGLNLPTVAEIEQMHDEARRSGHAEGFAEGRDKGYAEGQQVGYDSGYAAGLDEGREKGREEGRAEGQAEGKAAADDEAQRLRELFNQFNEAMAHLDSEIAEEMLSLSTELARKVLQHTLAMEPDVIISTIRAALQYLPQRRTQISLHPDDVALARAHLDEVLEQGGHLLIEDDSVSRGGCRVEAVGAQLDATMETRWRKVLDSLGRPHAPWASESDPATKQRRRASDEKPAAEKSASEKPVEIPPVEIPNETPDEIRDKTPVEAPDETPGATPDKALNNIPDENAAPAEDSPDEPERV